MRSAVKQMSDGINKIKGEMKHHAKPQDRHDKFSVKLKDFLSEAENRLKKLQEQYDLMEKKFDELAKYYCFDRKKVSMEEFFGDLSSFSKDFDVSGWQGSQVA